MATNRSIPLSDTFLH